RGCKNHVGSNSKTSRSVIRSYILRIVIGRTSIALLSSVSYITSSCALATYRRRILVLMPLNLHAIVT
ncbi:unnamed protein product, partial [Amoebophrya sp. A120]